MSRLPVAPLAAALALACLLGHGAAAGGSAPSSATGLAVAALTDVEGRSTAPTTAPKAPATAIPAQRLAQSGCVSSIAACKSDGANLKCHSTAHKWYYRNTAGQWCPTPTPCSC